jgi:hypothetical protein
MNKAMIESYVRNLAGQVIGAVMIVMQTSGAATPLDFGSGEWLLVANALWASLVPVILRYINKKDPAFGRVAASGLAELTKRLEAETSVAKKAAKKKK